MGKFTENICNAISGIDSEDLRAAEVFAMDDMDENSFDRVHNEYFIGATELDPCGDKYRTFRSNTSKDGTSYFLKIPSSKDPDCTWDLLKEEYQINRKLIEGHCPHIVKYFELAECSDGRPFIRAEYIHGETLADYLYYDASKRQKNDEVIVDYFRNETNMRRFIRQFLECLQRMHELSVVHHDLKPGNMLIDCVAGNLYVLDYDLSVGPSITNKTYGWTDGYEDPEAAELWNSGNRIWFDVFGPQFDIYSFGVIIKEIFYAYDLNMPAEYKRILEKCTCKRKERYQHVEDIYQDFMSCWLHNGRNIEETLKHTKTYQAAANGNDMALQMLQSFLEFEKSLK